MGLTIHLQLRLDASHTPEAVLAKLEQLHAFAQELPFDAVFPLVSPASRADEEMRPHQAWIERWADATTAPIDDEPAPVLIAQPDTAMGFLVVVGEGCDPCTIGMMQRVDASGARADWYWYAFSKTQYAANVSEAHFLQCHRTLVTLFDQVVALGFDATVTDEGDYWDTRDEQRLLEEIRKMNRLIAAFAGRLHDAMGRDKNLQAPIFEHPRFERLEMGLDE